MARETKLPVCGILAQIRTAHSLIALVSLAPYTGLMNFHHILTCVTQI